MTTCRLTRKNAETLKDATRDAIVHTRRSLLNRFRLIQFEEAEEVEEVDEDEDEPFPMPSAVGSLFESLILDYAQGWVRFAKSGRYFVRDVKWTYDMNDPLTRVDLTVDMYRGPPDRLNEQWAFEWDEPPETPHSYHFKFRNDAINELVTNRR